MLSSRQGTVPHVMVVTDRIGADIIGVTAGNVAERREVDGETEHIHRGRFGGWSHRRFQQRAENTWESNAKLVAEEVCEVAHKIGARVVTVAGDDRASHLLYEKLDTATHAIAKLLDVGSTDEIASATVRAVADVVASDTADVLRYFADRTASRGRGERRGRHAQRPHGRPGGDPVGPRGPRRRPARLLRCRQFAGMREPLAPTTPRSRDDSSMSQCGALC